MIISCQWSQSVFSVLPGENFPYYQQFKLHVFCLLLGWISNYKMKFLLFLKSQPNSNFPLCGVLPQNFNLWLMSFVVALLFSYYHLLFIILPLLTPQWVAKLWPSFWMSPQGRSFCCRIWRLCRRKLYDSANRALTARRPMDEYKLRGSSFKSQGEKARILWRHPPLFVFVVRDWIHSGNRAILTSGLCTPQWGNKRLGFYKFPSTLFLRLSFVSKCHRPQGIDPFQNRLHSSMPLFFS